MVLNLSKSMIGIGYIFSFLTLFFLISIFLIFLSPLTYIVSIILRSVGWILFARTSGRKSYALVGILDLVFGFLFFLFLFNVGKLKLSLGLSESMAVILVFSFWVIYSLGEWFAYLSLAREGYKKFYGSMISILGIIYIIYSLVSSVYIKSSDYMGYISQNLAVAILPLMISSLVTSLGIFTLDEERLVSIKLSENG